MCQGLEAAHRAIWRVTAWTDIVGLINMTAVDRTEGDEVDQSVIRHLSREKLEELYPQATLLRHSSWSWDKTSWTEAIIFRNRSLDIVELAEGHVVIL